MSALASVKDYLSSFDPRIMGLSGNEAATEAAKKAYRVYSRKVPGESGDYTMDHSAFVYLMGKDGGFRNVIGYQEKPDRALEKLKTLIERLTMKKVKLDINEITKPDLVSALVADNIAQQLERRIPHMRAMRKAAQATMQRGALGVKIEVAGRLNGSDMKRTDKVMEGRIPRSTLRADIDFAKGEALTTFGQIGVKVWICKGEVLDRSVK